MAQRAELMLGDASIFNFGRSIMLKSRTTMFVSPQNAELRMPDLLSSGGRALMSRIDFKERVAIVTGAGGGLGAALPSSWLAWAHR